MRVVEKGSLDEQAAFEVDEVRRQAAVAAAAARASIPEGGGTAVAAAEAVARGHDSSSRITSANTASTAFPKSARAAGTFQMRPNVGDGGAAPLFVTTKRAAGRTADSRSSSSVQGGGGKGGSGAGHSHGALAGGSVSSGASHIEGWNDSEENSRGRGRSGRGGRGGRDPGQDGGRGRGGRNSGQDGGRGRGRRGQGGRGENNGEASVGEGGSEGGLRGVWKERRNRVSMRMQDISREDIFDRFAEDVRVLYGDTSTAEAASCAR